MTSYMIYIVALGVGFKCPRKIHFNTQWGGGDARLDPPPVATALSETSSLRDEPWNGRAASCVPCCLCAGPKAYIYNTYIMQNTPLSRSCITGHLGICTRHKFFSKQTCTHYLDCWWCTDTFVFCF